MPAYLDLYDEAYFEGGESVSSYGRYSDCRHILTRWSDMVDQRFRPTSLLDVGAAYGFVIDWFTHAGVFALGVEPSAWARSQAVFKDKIVEGYLPTIDIEGPDGPLQFDVVTCTEVLEHLPPEDVPAALANLARLTRRKLVLLVMLEGHETAHDDAGHLTLQTKEWWNARLDDTGLRRDEASETWLDEHPFSEHIGWTGRFFVRERV